MKKIFNIVIMAAFISFTSIRPANALIIDPTSLAQKITEWVGKISDATNKIQQQIQQIKLTSLQGFKKDYLADIAGDYLKDYATDFAKKQLEMTVESTKQKQKQKLTDEQTFNKESSIKYYESKEQLVDVKLKEAKEEKEKHQLEVSSICLGEVPEKQSIYESLKASNASDEEIAKAADAYQTAQMQCDEADKKLTEAFVYVNTLEEDKKIIEAQRQIAGTEQDPEYKKYQDRIRALENSKDNEIEIGAKDESTDNWDDKKAIDRYTITQDDYVNFINKYFINENNIGNGLLEAQTEMDRVMRDRRRLFINTSVHLLQVTASIRRDIPTKNEKIKELYDEVRTTEDEFKAIGYYSGSKIDNIRALVIYAKILSNKLQYLAAKDLLVIEPRRRGSAEAADYENFDLGKYILTDSYVQAIEDESNKGIDIHQGVSEN